MSEINCDFFITVLLFLKIMLLEENKGPLIAFRVATFFRTEVNWRQQIGMILGQSDVTRLTESLSGIQVFDFGCISTGVNFINTFSHL